MDARPREARPGEEPLEMQRPPCDELVQVNRRSLFGSKMPAATTGRVPD